VWHTGLSGLRVLATLLLGHEAHAVRVEEVGGREAAEEEAHLVRGRGRVRVKIRVRVGVRVSEEEAHGRHVVPHRVRGQDAW
tara:strand:- start:806 stop:1051 length:246 start_codon:yes stop_codon:yes gene_type:complete